MSTEGEVRKASKQFYAGLNRMLNGDADPLAEIWSHSAAVTAMHPIGGRQSAGMRSGRRLSKWLNWHQTGRLN